MNYQEVKTTMITLVIAMTLGSNVIVMADQCFDDLSYKFNTAQRMYNTSERCKSDLKLNGPKQIEGSNCVELLMLADKQPGLETCTDDNILRYIKINKPSNVKIMNIANGQDNVSWITTYLNTYTTYTK